MKFRLLLSLVILNEVLVLSQIPTNGLVARYLFDGNIMNAVSGDIGANHGAVLITDRCSDQKKAFLFDASKKSYISLPTEQLVNIDEYTYSLWIKVSSFPPTNIDGWIIFAVGSSTSGYEQAISIHPNGGILGGSYNIGNDPNGSWTKTTPIETNKWFHIVLTRDFNSVKLYINGELMPNNSSYNPFTNNQRASYGSTQYSAIVGGRSNLQSDIFYSGSIDEICVYNRVLNLDEIKQLYYTNCLNLQLNGIFDVCQEQMGINYTVNAIDNAICSWNYSGIGAEIKENSSHAMIDFSDSATSGILSVKAQLINGSEITTSQFVSVEPKPFNPGIIEGKLSVCANESSVIYTVPLIKHAEDYEWKYSGSGANILGNANEIRVSFSSIATDGYLTVKGINKCGAGRVSESLLISIKDVPVKAGYISGDNAVCQGEDSIYYSTSKIKNASSYIWDYTGSGATIQGNSQDIVIYFDEHSSSGKLIVMGQNECGLGEVSEGYKIEVKFCAQGGSEPLNIPNSFSPNSDGINDVFYIRGLPANSRLFIFDRSGYKIFETNNYNNDWNGKNKQGQTLESETYWYVLILPFSNKKFRGFVYLKR